jgi:hypothetical protein
MQTIALMVEFFILESFKKKMFPLPAAGSVRSPQEAACRPDNFPFRTIKGREFCRASEREVRTVPGFSRTMLIQGAAISLPASFNRAGLVHPPKRWCAIVNPISGMAAHCSQHEHVRSMFVACAAIFICRR